MNIPNFNFLSCSKPEILIPTLKIKMSPRLSETICVAVFKNSVNMLFHTEPPENKVLFLRHIGLPPHPPTPLFLT